MRLESFLAAKAAGYLVLITWRWSTFFPRARLVIVTFPPRNEFIREHFFNFPI